MIVVAVLTATLSPLSPRVPTAYGVPGFVTRSGSALSLNGEPFRFTGLNIYNANSRGACSDDLVSGSAFDDALGAIGSGHSAVRSWFFQPLAQLNGQRDWSAFDHTLSVADAHGVKVIATLSDEWGECGDGGLNGTKTKSWFESGYSTAADAGLLVPYRAWVQEVVARYQDDPRIAFWELMNEPEIRYVDGQGADLPCPSGDEPADILAAWAADVSGLIKSLDSNHLVSVGTLGGGQCGAAADHYQTVHAAATVDLCTFHDYDAANAMPGDQWNGLAARIQLCNEIEKPIFVGEVGIKPQDVGGTLQARADRFTEKVAAQFDAGVQGVLAWAWDSNGSTLDDFDIGPGDPALDALTVPGMLSVVDVSLTETNSSVTNASVTVSLSRSRSSDVTFDLATIVGGTATPTPLAHADYTSTDVSGLVIAAGQTSTTLDIPVAGELVREDDETFFVQISGASVPITDDTATVTILDDDGLPALSIGDAYVNETDSGTTNVALSIGAFGGTSQVPMTVHYQTSNGTAVTPDDYVETSGTAIIPAYASATTVTVGVKGDTTPEGLQSFTVSLDSPTGATISGAVGTVTIDDDEFAQLTGAGGPHTCARMGGFVKCWGANSSGQVGDGTLVKRTRPTIVRNEDGSPLKGATQVVAGGEHSCARLVSTRVVCWGRNNFGQLGNNPPTLANSKFPVEVQNVAGTGPLTGVVSLAGRGGYYTCARLTGGTAVCWGSNAFGQLGNNTLINSKRPVVVKAVNAPASGPDQLTGITQIVAGGYHTCAVLNGGGAACWGRNVYAELGDNTLTQRQRPVRVKAVNNAGANLVGASQLAAGGAHTCARFGDGTAACWGYGLYGQRGDNTVTYTEKVPRWVVNGSNVKVGGVAQIAAGANHTCARSTTTNTVLCWGLNSSGQIGDNTVVMRKVPTTVKGVGAIGTLAAGVEIVAGGNHSCVRFANGNAYCWGANESGQLGDGTSVLRKTPVAVVGSVAVPNSMAALGDSVTAGYNACSASAMCLPASWSTGTTVNSHYQRILAINSAAANKAFNYAALGAKMSALVGQVNSAVSQRVQYVTILIGGNDVCTSTESTMTPVTSFESQFRAAMDTLTAGLPYAKVLVVSIPDVHRLWFIGQSSLSPSWCPTMFANPMSTDPADVARRDRVRQRIIDLNTVLATVCAQYANCRFDDNAVFAYQWTSAEISNDYLHPNPTGQNTLATLSYTTGYNW